MPRKADHDLPVMKHYTGTHPPDGPEVMVLDRSHSTGGYQLDGQFAWGCPDGATQLAVAILTDALGDEAKGRKLAPEFKLRVVARLPEEWELSQEDVRQLVARIEKARSR